jgi:hypothetical protein
MQAEGEYLIAKKVNAKKWFVFAAIGVLLILSLSETTSRLIAQAWESDLVVFSKSNFAGSFDSATGVYAKDLQDDGDADVELLAPGNFGDLITGRQQGSLQWSIFLPAVFKNFGLPSCQPDPPGESDNVDDALIVCSGQTVSGQVSDADWDDVYKIRAMVNQELTISMNGSGGDADLFLFPPGTTDIENDPYVDSSAHPGNDEFLQGTVLTAGFWYIDVYSYEGTTNYNVTVTLSDPGAAGTKTFDLAGTDQMRGR